MFTSGMSLPKESFTKPNILAFFWAKTEENIKMKATHSKTILLPCNKVDLTAIFEILLFVRINFFNSLDNDNYAIVVLLLICLSMAMVWLGLFDAKT